MKKDGTTYTTECQTRYPLFFIHGIGFRDNSKFYSYWGRITDHLKRCGAKIFFSRIGTIHDNAVKIKAKLAYLIKTETTRSLNVLSHRDYSSETEISSCSLLKI